MHRDFEYSKRVQSWDKPFKCDECSYNTTQSVNVMTDKLVHSREKPFTCDEFAYSTTCTLVWDFEYV